MNSNLVSENDLDGRRHKREWEKVKQPKQIIDASKGSYRSLCERMRDQKRNHVEPHKSKNSTKSANDNQIEFCDQKINDEHFKDRNQKQDVIDYRNNYDQRAQSGRMKNEHSCDVASQNHVNKASPDKRNQELSNGRIDSNVDKNFGEPMHDSCRKKRKGCEHDSFQKKFLGSGLTCVGILPGLDSFVDSSDDSDQSSSGSEGNENTKYDLLGRRIVYGESKSSNENSGERLKSVLQLTSKHN